MKSIGNDWYKKIWSLDIKNQSWVEDTANQVDFIIKAPDLNGNERILDLACGFGRHSLELARRGFDVTGVDITPSFVDDASRTAARENLDAHFLCLDIREVGFENEFDVVLNLADGAIGYLENDKENLKIFDAVVRVLKPGGKNFMDIMNADYADERFPIRLWDSEEKALTLSKFEWNRETRIMMYGQRDIMYGDVLEKYEPDGCPTRLYNIGEVAEIMNARGMKVTASYSDYYGAPSSSGGIQLMVCSQKNL